MPAFNRFDVFTTDLTAGKHDFSAHVYKIMWTNTAPVAANAVKTDIVEITAQNGYAAGGAATTITRTNTAGQTAIKGTDVTYTASGGSFGPLRYAVIYNDTQTTPAKPLIGWWDYGSSISINADESITLNTAGNATDVILTVG